jgi:hypothetical protein
MENKHSMLETFHQRLTNLPRRFGRRPSDFLSTFFDILYNSSRVAATDGLEIEITAIGDPPHWPRDTPLLAKVGTNFGRYSSITDLGHGVCFVSVSWVARQNVASLWQYRNESLFRACCCMKDIIFDSEEGTSAFLRNAGKFLQYYPVSKFYPLNFLEKLTLASKNYVLLRQRGKVHSLQIKIKWIGPVTCRNTSKFCRSSLIRAVHLNVTLHDECKLMNWMR